MLPSLIRLPILLSLSLSLLWWLALGVTAAAHLLWWPLLCFLRGISFCSSSAVSSSSYFCYGCCQLLLSLLGVSVQLVLVHLRFFHSVPCGWLPFWGSPAGCSFTHGRPYGKRSSSSSRSGGRQRFRGVGGEGSFFRPFGFPEVGTFSFPAPFRRLSVPPLAGLEGQGCGALGCRGAAGGLLSALPQHSSSFQCSHPNAFFQPHLHQGGCSGGGHLGLHCQGCCGASSTPFSRLLQPSVRSVEDLGVMASGHRPLPSHSLCGRVSLPDGDHSVCAPVSASGGLDGLHHSDGSVPSSAGSSSFSSLSSLHVPRHCLSFQSAVLWPLRCSAGLPQGHGSCFCYTPFSGGPYETVSRRLARPVTLSGVPPRGSSDCPPTLSRVGDCGQPPAIQPGSITGGSVSGGCHRLRLFQGFSVGGAHLPAAVNSRRVSVLRLAYRSLMAIAPRRPFFAGSPRSWRQTEDAVPPALPPSFLGSSGSGSSGVYIDGVSSRHPVVTPSPSSISRSVSLPGVSRLTLLVSRLRRGWGAHLDRQIASGLWAAQQAALSLMPGNCYL